MKIADLGMPVEVLHLVPMVPLGSNQIVIVEQWITARLVALHRTRGCITVEYADGKLEEVLDANWR
jgi:hypothetical protein